MDRSSPSHRSVRVWAVVLLAALMTLLLPATPASAVTVSVSGSINPATSPETPITPLINTPNCVGSSTFTIHYAIIPMVALQTGTYTVTEPGSASAIVVSEGPANTADISATCLRASNSNPTNLPVDLVAGTRYDIVVFDDTFTQLGLDYTVGVDGPAAVALGTADLGITLAAAPTSQTPGRAVTLTATVTNGGPQAATNPEVVLTLPAGVDPASITGVAAGAGYTCNADLGAGTVTCAAATHPVGATATISFTATVAAGATPGTVLTADGSVASDTVEASPADNSATADVAVAAPASTTTTTTATAPPTTQPVVGAVVATPRYAG